MPHGDLNIPLPRKSVKEAKFRVVKYSTTLRQLCMSAYLAESQHQSCFATRFSYRPIPHGSFEGTYFYLSIRWLQVYSRIPSIDWPCLALSHVMSHRQTSGLWSYFAIAVRYPILSARRRRTPTQSKRLTRNLLEGPCHGTGIGKVSSH